MRRSTPNQCGEFVAVKDEAETYALIDAYGDMDKSKTDEYRSAKKLKATNAVARKILKAYRPGQTTLGDCV